MQASRRQLAEYSSLLGQAGHHHETGTAVCDRCLQPIDEKTYRANVARLEAAVDEAAAAHRNSAEQTNATGVCFMSTCWVAHSNLQSMVIGPQAA